MLNTTVKAKPIKSTNEFPVVGIGASAGGLDAFKKLLKAIPEDSGIAYVLVQHLDPKRESMLPEILRKFSVLPVSEISDDVKVEPNHIYIIPSNKMLLANDGVLQLSARPAGNKKELNLPIDLFFTSLAEVHQAHAIGVVLSGTASDGTRGLKAIKDHGGLTFAQDEASAQYEGMPHSAVQAGVVDFILPPEEIPAKLIEITRQINRTNHRMKDAPLEDEEVFKQILALLRFRKGTDFTYYKQTTIRRRILRRMALNKSEEAGAYLKFLRENKSEQDILYQDLLIPVTSFFRDSKSFENLCESVFPIIVKNKAANEPIRIWVAGCSTGEEAFSIAICIREFLNNRVGEAGYKVKAHQDMRVQIFATDISEPAITKARRAIYSKAETEGLTPDRLQEFFIKTNGRYQVHKSIRDMCVFAMHNFLKDPPFAKMDLVCCRNVLIYMEPYLQKKALTTFHYALLPSGFLLLGKSETSGSVPDLFSPIAKNDKLFARKDMPSKYMHVTSQRSEQSFREIDTGVKVEGKLADFQKTADDILLSKFSPAGVVVNEAMEIVHFRGATGAYLEPSPGKASFNLLKMIKEGLAFELRNILYKAKSEKIPVVRENIPVQIKGEQRYITIEAIPLKNLIEPHWLVLFHDNHPIITTSAKKQPGRNSAKLPTDEKDTRIKQLEQELSQTREDMRTITEDQEAANEELQSANEELLSGSEELQSLNEEMETSKEELQSTNEELIVVNQEMVSLNELVTEARNYAEAIVSTIKEPLIILDKTMRVKSANLSFYKFFMVSENETEGKLLFELGDGQWNLPELHTALERIIPEKHRMVDFELKQVFPHIGERIMLLNAREMKEDFGSDRLILVAIEDVTEERVAENKIKESEEKFRNLADFIPQIIWTALPDGTFDYFNQQWYAFIGSKDDKESHDWITLLHEEDKSRCANAWFRCIETGDPYSSEYRFKELASGGYRWFLAKATAIRAADGSIKKWVGSFADIHEQKTAAEELQNAKEKAEISEQAAKEAVRSKQQFLSNMSHEIRTPMNAIIGFTNVVLRTSLTEKQREYVNAIKTSGEVMIVLINDILDLAKVDAGKMTFEKIPFELAETVTTMLHLFQIKLQEKNIALVKIYDPLIPKVLSGDPVRLHQVILNLMSNAVKFTNEGTITMGVRLLKEEKDQVELEFSVADTGMGIPGEKLQLIFENFEQAYNDNSRLFGGTGLGLPIVKKLVEAQGGTISVKSKEHIGSVFTFTLRFLKTNEKPVTNVIEELVMDSTIKQLKVLLVEDMPLNQLLMRTLLEEAGFSYDSVDNGQQAIEKLTQAAELAGEQYDIVLMDLQMPVMNGFETAIQIRNVIKLDIPIIGLTADVTPEVMQKCRDAGMNDYLSKPVDEKLLFSKIISLTKFSVATQPAGTVPISDFEGKDYQVVDLRDLIHRTKSNRQRINDLVKIYLRQTPPLLEAMKKSVEEKDLVLLRTAAHKILPSFAMIGMPKMFETIARQLLQDTGKDGEAMAWEAAEEIVEKITAGCKQAFIELESALHIINK